MTHHDAPVTTRDRAKADRRATLLDAAARLFAERGFDRVSLEDLGSAAGVSGPAVYRHFPGKQAVLAALLVGVSENLHAGGTDVAAGTPAPADALAALVAFHVDFALANADVIRVQDRDLGSLAADDRHTVRTLQRGYVDVWVDTLGRVSPEADRADLRIRAQATFGLINSTPHTARNSPRGRVRALLEGMATAALTAPAA
jgi:AcrR family transcriptional regulator